MLALESRGTIINFNKRWNKSDSDNVLQKFSGIKKMTVLNYLYQHIKQ